MVHCNCLPKTIRDVWDEVIPYLQFLKILFIVNYGALSWALRDADDLGDLSRLREPRKGRGVNAQWPEMDASMSPTEVTLAGRHRRMGSRR